MKKGLAFVLAAVMVLSLAGCNKGTTDGAKNVTINVTTTYAGNDGNAENFQNAVKAWEKETGNKVNDSSATSDETFKARILADFETGAEPDVLFFFNGVDSNAFVEAGKVVSIEEIRKQYPEYASNMKDGMMGASPVDGKNYSVPVNGYWESLFVNKKVCEAAGVKVPDKNTTWAEFMDICEKLKNAGYTPIATSLAQVPHYWFEYSIYNFLAPATHNILPKTTSDLQGDAWVKGISDIKDLYERGYLPSSTLTSTDDETFQMFIEDKAAFLIDGSWKVGGIESSTDDISKFTVSYVPGKNNRKTTDIIGGLSSGYYITKKAWNDPEKRAAAVSFVEYMTSDEMVSKFAGATATALKNGVSIDTSSLSSLAVDGLNMIAGATGMAGAVQDQVPAEARVPVFDGMPKIVTGKADVKTSVEEVLKLLYK